MSVLTRLLPALALASIVVGYSAFMQAHSQVTDLKPVVKELTR